MNDRIKLAEAMGWTHDEIDENCWHSPDDDPKGPWTDTAYHHHFKLTSLPDPYTDANDDYSVLVWMREHHKWQEFKPALGKLREESIYWRNSQFTWMYQIGDYARAALKVIDDE